MTDAVRLATVEARWFGQGHSPETLTDWFARGGPVRREPERTDRYLRLPGVVEVGVKLREGRLEIKACRVEPAGQAVWAGVSSPVAGWLKWSAPIRELPGDAVAPIDVTKWRQLGRHEQGPDAVEVEFAELAIEGETWWSFGVEATSVAALEAVLTGEWARATPAVAVTFSGSYPAWLARWA